MTWLRLAPWAMAAMMLAICVLGWFRLQSLVEANAVMKERNKVMAEAIEEQKNALRNRAKIEEQIRGLSPDDVLKRLQ